MRLLERYIFVELLRVFACVLCVTTCLLVFVGVYEKMKEYGFGPWEVAQILPFIVPSLLPYTIPATLLLTVCVVYGRLAGDREIIAAKAAGIHAFSLVWPSYFLGAMLSVAALLLMDQVIPWSLAHIERVGTLSAENIFLDTLRTQNQFVNKERGITITVTEVRDRTLIWPIFRYAPNGSSAVTMQAQSGRLEFDLPNQQVVLHLQHGYVDVPGGNRFYFESEEKPFPLPTKNQRLRARNLRIRDIQAEFAIAEQELAAARQRQALSAAWILSTGHFERLAEKDFHSHHRAQHEAQAKLYKLDTELHNRFATSCSCLFFVLLGSPFAMVLAKKQFLTSFLFCFVPILVVYYPVSIMTQNMSKTGQLDPLWAVWAANGLMLLAAGYFFRRVLQH
jgi:lipopolysaccharide export system permease protein